jgi:hypothetical protein
MFIQGVSEYTKDHQNPFLRFKRQASLKYKEELVTVVQRASASESNDMRDRIYGVVAMSRNQDIIHGSREDVYYDRPMVLDIDYSRNASQVYQDVIKFYARSSGCVDIFMVLRVARLSLDHTTLFGGQVNGYRIPSWCPNFSMPWEFGRSRKMSPMIVNELFFDYTSKQKRADNQAFFERSFTSEILHVKGIQLARVEDRNTVQHTGKDKTFITIRVHPWRRLKPARTLENVEIDSNDIIVAVDRSDVLCILRPSKDRRCFTFVEVDRVPFNELDISNSWYELLENNSHHFEEFKIE